MYRLVFCAAAAHTLKYRSCFAYRRASGTPPPYAIGRNILVERRGDVGIAPYGGRKRVSGQMRRGTWPPPYNFRSKELCRAGHTGSATKGALCSYISHRQRQRRRRRERFFISCPLHSTPKRVGLTPTTCNVRGARRKPRNHPVSGGVFFILFAAVGKKYVAKGIPIPIPKKLKKPES